ncbi:MAG: M20/M25/M40 family metallo-hydrolase [Desulfobacterales bacterium]|jgi:succinyl-diaminopimelate desuccinylase
MEELIKLTQDLIRFKTMHSQPEEIQRCMAFIEDYLNQCEANYRRLDHAGIPSIIVMPQNNVAPILLMSHIDVVDAPDDLFQPRIKNNALYGRGSIDDKYAVALSLVMLKEHLLRLNTEGKNQNDLQFGVMITADEEIGGANGARQALKEIKAEFCIALDGGGLNKIVIKEKGIVKLKLIARGKTAHGARPWLGENAIENLINDYQVLKTHFELSTPDHWHRTLNLAWIQAGTVSNQVPDYAEALFDIRYTENDDMESLLKNIQGKIKGGLVVEKIEPLFEGGDTPYLDLLLEMAPDTKVGFEHGASDARFLSAHGIKGIVWGADGDLSQHSADEHINIDSLYQLYDLLDNFITRSAEKGIRIATSL